MQALSKGASTTQALAAADAAAAAVVDRLVSDTSTILMSGYINYGRNVVFDLIREKGRRLSAISTAGSANRESGDESNARKAGIYGHCHVSRAARPECRNGWLRRRIRTSKWQVRNQTLSPVREKRQNLFPLKFISSSERSNFKNRTEWKESRASERNGPFGEQYAGSADRECGELRNRCCYWA